MKTKLFLLASAILGMLAVSCQDDPVQEEPSGKGEVLPAVNMEDLSAAMQWYEMHQMEQYATRSGERHPLFEKVIPDWTSSYSGENGDSRTVETYLGVLNPGIYVAEDASRAYEETKDVRYLTALSRLVVLFPKEDGEAMGFYMTVVPSRAYLEKTDFKPFTNNSYTVRDKELDGYVLYHSLDGQLINGWVYEKGKITLAIYGTNHSDETTPQTRAGTMPCIAHYEYYCTDYYYTVNGGDPIYNGHTCTDAVLVGLDCNQSGSSDGVGGGYDGGAGGVGNLPQLGGGSTAYMSNNLKKLFKDHKIPKEGVELFNKALDEALADCFYKQLFDYLVTQEKIGTIIIKADMPGVAAVGLEGNSFKVIDITPETINAKSLEHEMIHMVQIRCMKRTLNKDKDAGMLEFERFLIHDLYRYIRLKQDSNWNWEKSDIECNEWACWGEVGVGRNDLKKRYMTWLDALTNWGTSFPSRIDENDFKQWSVIFGGYSREYNSETRGYKYGLSWDLTIPFITNKINATNCLKK